MLQYVNTKGTCCESLGWEADNPGSQDTATAAGFEPLVFTFASGRVDVPETKFDRRVSREVTFHKIVPLSTVREAFRGNSRR